MYLELYYTLVIEKFGRRRVDLLISTTSGKTSMIANQLLECEEMVYVGMSIGEHTIDLRAEIIIKDSAELLDVLEVKILGRRERYGVERDRSCRR